MEMDINTDFSPHDLLPIKDPRQYKETREFFYTNVVKYLIPDILRITSNGTPINLERVLDLEKELNNILKETKEKLFNNPLILKYLKNKRKSILKEECKHIKLLLKNVDTESKELFKFNYNNIQHRTFVVNYYLSCNPRYVEYQMNTWKIKDLYKLNMLISSNFINKLINHTLDEDNEFLVKGMKAFVKHKVYEYNVRKVKSLKKFSNLEEFNPNSSTQKAELFNLLGIEIDEKTETGQMKTSREEIEKLLYEYRDLISEDNDNEYYQNIIEILEAFISQSNSAIIKNTFINAFYLHSIDSVLYSSLQLFGTKTFRCTSSNPKKLGFIWEIIYRKYLKKRKSFTCGKLFSILILYNILLKKRKTLC